MEFASWLAGERFSDHPQCTHPLLATLARSVNDTLTDRERQRILPLVSEVVGLVGDDPLVEPTITALAATTAMPVACYEHQKVLAVGLLRCEQELASLDGHEVSWLRERIQGGLDHCPDATRWARRFVERPWGRGQNFTRAAPHVVHLAVLSISTARTAPDLLCELLEGAVAECEKLLRQPAEQQPAASLPPPAMIEVNV
jgi:hypothetical protein